MLRDSCVNVESFFGSLCTVASLVGPTNHVYRKGEDEQRIDMMNSPYFRREIHKDF